MRAGVGTGAGKRGRGKDLTTVRAGPGGSGRSGHRLGLLARVPACAQRESAVARSAKRKLAIGATGTADRLGAATEDVAAAGGAAVDAAAASRVPPPSKISLPRPTMSPRPSRMPPPCSAIAAPPRPSTRRRRLER